MEVKNMIMRVKLTSKMKEAQQKVRANTILKVVKMINKIV